MGWNGTDRRVLKWNYYDLSMIVALLQATVAIDEAGGGNIEINSNVSHSFSTSRHSTVLGLYGPLVHAKDGRDSANQMFRLPTPDEACRIFGVEGRSLSVADVGDCNSDVAKVAVGADQLLAMMCRCVDQQTYLG